jgi:hypothetical protein
LFINNSGRISTAEKEAEGRMGKEGGDEGWGRGDRVREGFNRSYGADEHETDLLHGHWGFLDFCSTVKVPPRVIDILQQHRFLILSL